MNSCGGGAANAVVIGSGEAVAVLVVVDDVNVDIVNYC